MQVSFYSFSDKRRSGKTFLEVSVMFRWSVLRQNADGALTMLQYNNFSLRNIWATAANVHIKHSLPRHWNVMVTVNVIHFMYVVSKCMTTVVKLLRLWIHFIFCNCCKELFRVFVFSDNTGDTNVMKKQCRGLYTRDWDKNMLQK